MFKYLISIFVLMLVQYCTVSGRDFSSKVHTEISYWYNYYYDPGVLKAQVSDSMPSNSANNDQTIADSLASADSLSEIKCRDEQSGVKAINNNSQTEDYVIDTLNRQDLRTEEPIYFVDSTPCLDVLLAYNGDSTDLEVLGVEWLPWGGYFPMLRVRFPLSILPQVDELTTIQKITLRPLPMLVPQSEGRKPRKGE